MILMAIETKHMKQFTMAANLNYLLYLGDYLDLEIWVLNLYFFLTIKLGYILTYLYYNFSYNTYINLFNF